MRKLLRHRDCKEEIDICNLSTWARARQPAGFESELVPGIWDFEAHVLTTVCRRDTWKQDPRAFYLIWLHRAPNVRTMRRVHHLKFHRPHQVADSSDLFGPRDSPLAVLSGRTQAAWWICVLHTYHDQLSIPAPAFAKPRAALLLPWISFCFNPRRLLAVSNLTGQTRFSVPAGRWVSLLLPAFQVFSHRESGAWAQCWRIPNQHRYIIKDSLPFVV